MPTDDRRNVLAPRRMVGAATVITGRFQRAGGRLHVAADALRADWPGPHVVARTEGALADLAELERGLFDALVDALGLVRPRRRWLRRISRRSAAAAAPIWGHARSTFAASRRSSVEPMKRRSDWVNRPSALVPEDLDAIGLVGVCLARLGHYAEAESRHRHLGRIASERRRRTPPDRGARQSGRHGVLPRPLRSRRSPLR